MPDDPTKALNEVVRILGPLSPEDRRRVVKGAMAFHADDLSPAPAAPEHTPEPSKPDSVGHWAASAHKWMKQNGITAEQLDQVFEFDNDGKVRILEGLPGKGMRSQTINAYRLVGLATFLMGQQPFDDDLTRGECERHSCYDKNNHAATLNKEMKSELMGSRSDGWTLRKPGIDRATEVLKEIVGITK